MILDIMPIPLTQGLFALVDGEDYERINKHKWYADKLGGIFYAVRVKDKKMILMHREVLQVPKGIQTDHRNHCGLDNRKCSVRLCTIAENQHNQLPQKGRTSRYKGVSWLKGKLYKGHRYNGKWQAQIRYNGKLLRLGSFINEIDAAKTYDQAARELFGEFANCNFS